MRRFFIIQVARELHLIFPTPSATAITIRSLHLAAEGASSARRKMKALSWAFVIALVHRVASQYAVGLLWVRVSLLLTLPRLLTAFRIGISLLGFLTGELTVMQC